LSHDYRDDYRCLADLKDSFPDVSLTCLTATATDDVVRDVKQILADKGDWVEFKPSLNCANIHYEVMPKSASKQANSSASGAPSEDLSVASEMAHWIKVNYPHKSGIIYCLRKRDCLNLVEELEKKKLEQSVDCYHADLSADDRKHVQWKWSEEESMIICTTSESGISTTQTDTRGVAHAASSYALR
jgi:superfamily II DNA helicase RecQ